MNGTSVVGKSIPGGTILCSLKGALSKKSDRTVCPATQSVMVCYMRDLLHN